MKVNSILNHLVTTICQFYLSYWRREKILSFAVVYDESIPDILLEDSIRLSQVFTKFNRGCD